jgi:glutathione S-transferase
MNISKSKYLMGRDYSIADAHLFVVSNWTTWVNFDLSPYTNVTSCRKRIAGRHAVHAALEAEGLIPWPNSPP